MNLHEVATGIVEHGNSSAIRLGRLRGEDAAS